MARLRQPPTEARQRADADNRLFDGGHGALCELLLQRGSVRLQRSPGSMKGQFLHASQAALVILAQVATQGIATDAAQLADGAMGQVLALEVEDFAFALDPRVRMLETLAFEELDVLEGEFELKYKFQATNRG